jgi:hypothetical protein
LGGTGGGFGPIANGSTLTWTFDTTFTGPIGSTFSGNIRAAFNNSNGNNFNIFSPGGGTSDGGGSDTVVPEPASLALFGLGALAAAARARRRKSA